MREVVSDVIAVRTQDPRGLSRTITWSFAIHITVLTLVAVLPRMWLFRPAPAAHHDDQSRRRAGPAFDGHDADRRPTGRGGGAGAQAAAADRPGHAEAGRDDDPAEISREAPAGDEDH